MEENSGTTILDTCFSDDRNQTESPDTQTTVAMAGKHKLYLSTETLALLMIF